MFSTLTGIAWTWANWKGKLPEPEAAGIDPSDLEIRTQPRM
jgi:hypothetical protein